MVRRLGETSGERPLGEHLGEASGRHHLGAGRFLGNPCGAGRWEATRAVFWNRLFKDVTNRFAYARRAQVSPFTTPAHKSWRVFGGRVVRSSPIPPGPLQLKAVWEIIALCRRGLVASAFIDSDQTIFAGEFWKWK